MKGKVKIAGFRWELEIVNEDGTVACREVKDNLIPSDGLDFLIRAPFGDISPVSTFYLGLYRGNYIPSSSTTSADIPSNMNEMIDYSEVSRPEWMRELTGISTYDNSQNKAEFTVTQARTVHGAFLVSDPNKGSNSGLLLSCVRFSSPKNVEAGQTVKLSGGITYTSTSLI